MSIERSAIEGSSGEDAAGATGNGAAPAQETLTVTDNRTGRSYELPIKDGTVRGLDLGRSRPTTRTSG